QLVPASDPWTRWFVSLAVGVAAGGALAAITEIALIRPLYARPTSQVLVTVGLALAALAVVQGAYGSDPISLALPAPLGATTHVLGAAIPNSRILVIAAALAVLGGLLAFLRTTRFGLIVRAGVDNREMVTALGIDVRTAFTLVFVIGGMAAGLAGVLAGTYDGSLDPARGTSVLIFAFIVVVIGGLGSVTGSAVAAVAVGEVQQFLNFYAAPGTGDFAVVLLLAAVLLARPGELGSRA
ncbi:MAG: branched-chain amino acid ABC transporter permease, partial [Candidatus Eremiobacteraeota bacterium]|nr:branched-chain amino acid ABC transporter permease [Candidatus Eremiobacteraeota bacterium]